MSSKKAPGGGLAQLLYGGTLRDPAIMKAAARVYHIRERSKRLKKRLKDREDAAVLVLVAALMRRGLEACRVGPYVVMADSRIKIRITKKLGKEPARKRKPAGKK